MISLLRYKKKQKLPTCNQHNRSFVWVKLHLSGYPGTIEVGVPPALLLILRVFVLVCRADERNAEISLLAIHGHFLMLGRHRWSWVLFSCSESVNIRILFLDCRYLQSTQQSSCHWVLNDHITSTQFRLRGAENKV